MVKKAVKPFTSEASIVKGNATVADEPKPEMKPLFDVIAATPESEEVLILPEEGEGGFGVNETEYLIRVLVHKVARLEANLKRRGLVDA